MTDRFRTRRDHAATYLAALGITSFWMLAVGPLPLFSQAPGGSRELSRLDSGQARPAKAERAPTGSAVSLFRVHCLSCHAEDGRGDSNVRSVPDFTDMNWQTSQTDPQLEHAILEGQGKSMPAMKGKLARTEVAELIVLIRMFQGGRQVISEEEADQVLPDTPGRSDTAVARVDSPRAQDAKAALSRSASPLFQRSCRSCHGSDGKGEAQRVVTPEIPDFSSPTWHERRNRAELKASILAGKGAHMPGFDNSVTDEQARMLVELIRAFSPIEARPQDASTRDFDTRLAQLRQEFESLRREYRALSPVPDTRVSGPKTR